jgi:hypothetical protein
MGTPAPAEDHAQASEETKQRHCRVCGVKLSAYNRNPYCWQHTIGHPWRGPTARPKY